MLRHDGYIFPVTAEVVTADSAEQGDAAGRGYIDTCGRWQDVIPGWRRPDWWLCSLSQELADSVEGDVLGVTFSVHRPDEITDSSWLRVCRLLGCRSRH